MEVEARSDQPAPALPAHDAVWTPSEPEVGDREPIKAPARRRVPMGYGALAFPRVPPPRRRPGGGHGKATLGALSLPADPDDPDEGDAEDSERTVPLAVDQDGGIDQSYMPHPSTAPRDPDTGLPMYPTGPLTETPKWRKRNKPKSQFVKSIVLLVALLTIWLSVWYTMESLRPEDRPAEPEPPVTTTVPFVLPGGPGSPPLPS